jgi:glucokinase
MIALAADVGGTRIKLAVLRQGVVVARRIEAARAESRWETRLAGLAKSWRDLCREAAVDERAITGLAMGFPAVVDARCGRIVDEWGKFPGCAGFDFAGWARQHFNRPAAIENDARVALLGEWRHGAGRGCDDLVMVTLGTGIGVGVAMQGRVLRGAHGQAGTLGGHFTVHYGGRRCACGNVGCAEAEASTTVLRDVAVPRSDFSRSALALEPVLDYAAVFRHAAAGDTCARALREHSLAVWGAAIVNLIHAYDPARVIVGGGIMRSGGDILCWLREHVRRHAHTPWGPVELVAGQLGDDAALLGCGILLAEAVAGRNSP